MKIYLTIVLAILCHLGFSQVAKKDSVLLAMEEAIKTNPQKADLYIERANMKRSAGDNAGAATDYFKAIELEPNNSKAYVEYARLNISQNNMQAAVFALNKAIEVNPQNPQPYVELSKLNFRQRQINDALNNASKAIELDANNFEAYMARGDVYSMMNKNTEALTDYNKAISLGKSKLANDSAMAAGVYFNMAQCKMRLTKPAEALPFINKAIELGSNSKDINTAALYNMRGNIYQDQRKFQQAINDFNKSINLNPNYPYAYLSRAIAKVNMAENQNAKAYSPKTGGPAAFINLSPQNNLIANKEHSSTIASALKDCDKAIEMDPNMASAYYIRGQIKQTLKQNDFCEDLLKAQSLGIEVQKDLLKKCAEAK
ncbi:tetratricopeptide repeat protein [Danxiaibacter flavus]|uniref:Tetratricopeptide repeat protein n=1 Tax=Danxiaibacter flavus TaxID=3049108 RepID=A0ABV3ZD20_9BACT|nr:tetratricopeptide repeat protein [Chitinophagaceae bacterium DXS]